MTATSMIRRPHQLESDALQDIDDNWPGTVVALDSALEAVEAFQRLSHLPHCIFFDSAQRGESVGRYSFIAADPFEVFTTSPDDPSVWKHIDSLLRRFPSASLPELPPFQGGMAGMFGYELAHSLEQLPGTQFDEFQVPGVFLGLYDVVVAFDHERGKSWIISQGFPEIEPALRQRRGEQRAQQFRRCLNKITAPSIEAFHWRDRLIAADQLAPQFSTNKLPELTSNFSRDAYLEMVRRGVAYIYAGDVFQVNLAQRLLYPAREDAIALYLRLREKNPAPFAAYFDLGDFQIASASPERFLKVENRRVETRPIKGTCQRTGHYKTDQQVAEELKASEKDRAENVMIVDLLRNDLSRVCRPESVTVPDLCRLERYAFVQHLVSIVNGELADGHGPLDVLQATFPGGSVTGAPKVRAMEIIAELEPTARGVYCGALGYIGFDGAMDTSILIRTITACRGWWQFPVGGGIVAGSDPQREYEESWHKAEGLLRAIRR
jgi:para-aminobenzoate synthetase component I